MSPTGAEIVETWMRGAYEMAWWSFADAGPLHRGLAARIDAALKGERERTTGIVRKLYDAQCECDRVGDGPHRLSCEAGIGDDIAAAILDDDGRP